MRDRLRPYIGNAGSFGAQLEEQDSLACSMAWERTVAVYKFALARHRRARPGREERLKETERERESEERTARVYDAEWYEQRLLARLRNFFSALAYPAQRTVLN